MCLNQKLQQKKSRWIISHHSSICPLLMIMFFFPKYIFLFKESYCNIGPEYLMSFYLIALVSKVTLLEWISKFAQCWVPRESVLWGSGVHKATSTAQNLKVTWVTFETNAISITSSVHALSTYLPITWSIYLK